MTKSETEAKPWTEEELRHIMLADPAYPHSAWVQSRWLATLRQRDEEIARLKSQESQPLSASREETAKAHHDLASWKALALSATTRAERLEAAQRESDRVMTIEVEARREAETELQRARALLGTADRAVESVESMMEEIRTLKAQVRSADEASIAATRSRNEANRALSVVNAEKESIREAIEQAWARSEAMARQADHERAEALRLRSELDEVTRGALEAQDMAEALRKRVAELEAQVDRDREATLLGREMQQEAARQSEARASTRQPWCPTHGHYVASLANQGACPLCPSPR